MLESFLKFREYRGFSEIFFFVCVQGLSLTKPFFCPSQPGSCAWLSPFILCADCTCEITGLILAFFIGNTSSLTDLGQAREYKWCPADTIMGSTWCGITCITKAVSLWQVSCTSVQLGEPNGNDSTWTMTGTKCAAIKRLISIMHSGDKTEFINRLKDSKSN